MPTANMLTAQIHCDAFLSIYLAGWHPWDAEADSIDEELLFTMRTSGDKCKAAWDSEGSHISRAVAAVLCPRVTGVGHQ